MHGRIVKWNNYKLMYLPGKIFAVNNVRFYDLFSFWGTGFIKVVEQTLGKERVSHVLTEGKKSRKDFRDWDDADVLKYNFEELDLLVEIAEHLRSNLRKAGINLGSAYYGPGSIANYWFYDYGIVPREITDSDMIDVMERGYFGGRFESFEIGRFNPVWEADINSAYPAVIATLPYLDEWRWKPNQDYRKSTDFSIWRVEWHIPSESKIGPFPSRDKHGFIKYPANGLGWYWKPEVEAAIALYGDNAFTIHKGLVPSVVEENPFAWVEEKYEDRQRLKSAGDPSEWAYKVGLNSLYGKTAQRVGKARFFNLAWAGYITAATRAKLLRVAASNPDSVIAFATDAAFFKEDPKLQNTNKLGGWKVEGYKSGIFLASGIYRLERFVPKDGKLFDDGSRGVASGIQPLLDSILEHPYRHPRIVVDKFVSHLEAIRAPKSLGRYRNRFIKTNRTLHPYDTTKRKVTLDEAFVIQDDYLYSTDPDYWKTLVGKWGPDFVEAKMPDGRRFFVWPNYGILLKDGVKTAILDNHNDHESFASHEVGAIEESYPFRKLSDNNLDNALLVGDEIAGERLGDESDLVEMKSADIDSIAEEEILKEMKRNG